MRLIDADKFVAYLTFSKHIDRLTCGEVKEAIDMCKVNVLDKIRAEIEALYNTKNYLDGRGITVLDCLNIIDKYREVSE